MTGKKYQNKREPELQWDQWEKLIETTLDPIAIVDSEFVVLHFNQPFHALVPDFGSGRMFREIIIPEHHEIWDACLRDSSVNKVISMQVAVRSGDLIRYLAVRVLPVLDDGKPVKFLVICVDVTGTMNLEAELLRRNALLQKAEQIGGLGCWTWDVQSDQGNWSDNYYRMAGYEPQSFIPTAEAVTDRVHPEDRKILDEIDQKISARLPETSSNSLDFEYRMLKRQGGYINVLCRCEVERDSTGDPVRVTGVVLDITARKKIQEDLRRSNERWQFALDGADDGLWDWNPQTDEVFFSSRWKSMLGYEEHEIGSTKEEWSGRVHPDDLPCCYHDLDQHFRGETPIYHNEHRIRCKDGTYKWILARGKVIERNDGGAPVRIIGTHTDMTTRRTTEQALLKNEVLLDAVGQMALVGGWELDPKTSAVTWTKETYRIHEVPFDEKLPLEDAINFYHPDDRPILKLALDNAIDHGEPFDLVLRFITAKGRELYARAICSPVVEDGKVTKLLGTFQDITKLRKMELELTASNEQLKEERNLLEQKDTALRVLISQFPTESAEIKEQISQNVERLIKPALAKLRLVAGDRCSAQIDALEASIVDVTSPFIVNIEKLFVNLTPRETEICNYIRNGFRSKEIADHLNISDQTVAKSRQKIRKKFKIDGTSTSLSDFLRSQKG